MPTNISPACAAKSETPFGGKTHILCITMHKLILARPRSPAEARHSLRLTPLLHYPRLSPPQPTVPLPSSRLPSLLCAALLGPHPSASGISGLLRGLALVSLELAWPMSPTFCDVLVRSMSPATYTDTTLHPAPAPALTPPASLCLVACFALLPCGFSSLLRSLTSVSSPFAAL